MNKNLIKFGWIAIVGILFINSCQKKTDKTPTSDPNSYAYQVIRSAYVGAPDEHLGSITFQKINSDSGTYVSTMAFMGTGKYYKDKEFTSIKFDPENSALAIYPLLELKIEQADENAPMGAKFYGTNKKVSSEQFVFTQ